jgi:hypothetical protein
MGRSLVCAAIALVMLAGCVSAEQRVIGKWKGEVQLAQTAEASPLGAMIKGMAASVDPQLDLRPDNSFSLYLTVLPIEGTWALEGDDSVVLSPTKYGGVDPSEVQRAFERGAERWSKKEGTPSMAREAAKDLPKAGEPIRIKVSEDGKTLTLAKGQAGSLEAFGTVVFKNV